MKKYLALDSGGTKVLAVLYNEDFEPIRVARVGSFRDNTTPPELVRRNMDTLLARLELDKGSILDGITGLIDHTFYEQLREKCVIRSTNHCGEMEAGLHAAEIFGDGLLALSGTGATMFGRYAGKNCYAGAYGAAVSDIGSGYWMGREILNAAISDYEGWGEETLLTELVCRHFGFGKESPEETRKQLNGAIFSIYSRHDYSPCACVASCAPLATEAADQNDPVALRILQETGQVLGTMMTSMIRKHEIPSALPMTVSGSVWRGHRRLFDTFSACIREQAPERALLVPEFEPILGVMIRHWLQLHGKFDRADKARLAELYPEFRFSLRQKQLP
ncbi:MAG: hypothetical protein IKY52_05590 [Clostridia bacterium]|nr:hypothetical protein [Clostridia bacterium]